VAMNNNWTGRELEWQINSGLYERLLLSNDKKSVLEVARRERIPESPTEIINDPMVLEFLGLKRDAAYYEQDFERALINTLVKYTLPEDNKTIMASKYQRYLPTERQLLTELKRELENNN